MFRKVFISYASEDIDTAIRLYDYLLKNEYDPWLDKKKILVGQDWNNEIKTALRESDFIIFLLSKTSVSKRGYVQREFKIALEYCEEKLISDIYIIPCKINECEIPFELSKYQWVELNNQESFELINKSLDIQRKKYLLEEKNTVGDELNKLESSVRIIRDDKYVDRIPISYKINDLSFESANRIFNYKFPAGQIIIECKAQIWFNTSVFGSSTVGLQYLGKSEKIKFVLMSNKSYEILIDANRLYEITTSTYRTLFRIFRTTINENLPKVNDENTWPINIRVTINEF